MEFDSITALDPGALRLAKPVAAVWITAPAATDKEFVSCNPFSNTDPVPWITAPGVSCATREHDNNRTRDKTSSLRNIKIILSSWQQVSN
jgi:hypothetical protein